MSKTAIISVDVEEWYHLDYFRGDRSAHSVMDGLQNILSILDEEEIPASFFIVTELLATQRFNFNILKKYGDDVGIHSCNHKRPNTQGVEEFAEDLNTAINDYIEYFSQPPTGYRAPCFAIDKEKVELVRAKNFLYDSSKINLPQNKLYGNFDLTDYEKVSSLVYKYQNFTVFEVPTKKTTTAWLPIGGGGYFRIIPSWLYERWVRSYIRENDFYHIYLHPYEFSTRKIPASELDSMSFLNKFRMLYNRRSASKKLKSLIQLLKGNGYKFSTYRQYCTNLK